MPYKYKYLFFPMIFLLVLSFVGCNQKDANLQESKEKTNIIQNTKLDGKTIISATVSKVGESMADVKKPHITYTQENSKDLQVFVDAVRRAEKVNGVMDVTAPDFQITLTFKDKTISIYLLWLGDDGGAIMNENDTHTMYTLPSDLNGILYKYVK
ncbi:hypothetical protein [Cytobacillus firmus]|uniref:hypothetical protein n=1 Tax=Cytobacillus firmus TaxID=1399 RepID=UPI0018CCEEB5|nr:hypothetical protein [Cytobacillus firmus]MBG9587209.1 hypothetical protein [Cytobacillus firmus]